MSLFASDPAPVFAAGLHPRHPGWGMQDDVRQRILSLSMGVG